MVEVINGFIVYITKDDQTHTYVIDGKESWRISSKLSELIGEKDADSDSVRLLQN